MKNFNLQKTGLKEIDQNELSKINGGMNVFEAAAYYFGVFEGHAVNGIYMLEQASQSGANTFIS
jgi:bacteriocin-like protein